MIHGRVQPSVRSEGDRDLVPWMVAAVVRTVEGMMDRVRVERRSPIGESGAGVRLEAERSWLVGLIGGLEREGLDRESKADSIGEIAPSSQQEADVGSDTFERERDFSLLEDIQNELGEIEAALARLAQGSYGVCAGCYEPIDPDRLEAVPATRYCKACQDRYELGGALVAAPMTSEEQASLQARRDEELVEESRHTEKLEGDLIVAIRRRLSVDDGLDLDEMPAVPAERENVPRPRQSDEFLCSTCFQLKRRTQLTDPIRSRCVDCVNSSVG